jgi:hypothetical protein
MIGKNILPSNFNIGDNVIHYRDSSLKGKIVSIDDPLYSVEVL